MCVHVCLHVCLHACVGTCAWTCGTGDGTATRGLFTLRQDLAKLFMLASPDPIHF